MSTDAPVRVNFLGGTTPRWLTIVDGACEVGDGELPEPDLRFASADGGAATEAIRRVRDGDASPQVVLVAGRDGEWAPHPPYDVGAEEVEPQLRGASMLVQHVKRGSLLGTLRYYERFENGVLVERESGIPGGADIVVENTFARMVDAYADDDLVGSFGGAKIRGRDQGSMLLLAGIYASDRVRAHLGARETVNRLLVTVADGLTPEAWSSLSGEEGER